MPAPIIAGAEPWSADGGPHGALVLHGFTGNPASMRGVAEALHRAGFTVELPLLPGHGTTVEDLVPTTFADWLAEAEAALGRLQERLGPDGRAIVVGLSMGGALTVWLASDHPELAGIVTVNALVEEPDGIGDLVRQLVAEGHETMDAIGSDIAKPGVQESSYEATPLRPMLSLLEAAAEMPDRLRRVAAPVLVITSVEDHVVPPANSDTIAESVSGPVERMFLERSYHVATLDHDAPEIEAAVVAFAQKVTSR